MRLSKLVVVGLACAVLLLGGATSAAAPLTKNTPAPNIKALDINQNQVELKKVIEEGRDLVVLFFFSTNAGRDVARKLGLLDDRYGKRELEIIALGFEEDVEDLKAFSENLGIRYYIIDSANFENEPWIKGISELPLTLFVDADETQNIERVVRGGGRSQARILKEVAENLLLKGKSDAAIAVADVAVEEGEDAEAAGEVKGFALVEQGKLDEAEEAFGAIDSNTGRAKVALERGDYDRAAELAAASEDSLSSAIEGEALLRAGKTEEAAAALSGASASGEDWKQAELSNVQGRVSQMKGDTEGAVRHYQRAVELNPNDVVALSNEAAAYRETGKLDRAKEVLDKASVKRPDDQYVSVMLDQIAQELVEANDLRRQELIRGQIADLTKRFEEMKASGALEERDDWSTRPMVLALLPGRGHGVFFDRAGTDVVLQREMERKIQSSDQVAVVERTMLDMLLQELNLGSSELASPDTQRRLGKVVSAGVLGFFEFAQLGAQPVMYLRLVDVETTAIRSTLSQPVDQKNPMATVDGLVAQVLATLGKDADEVKGLVADAADAEAVIINIGRKHGVKEGQAFDVLQEGDPIEVGGRTIARRQRTVGRLTVVELEEDYAICRVANLRSGVELAKEMKIRAAK